jgi:hypothetical protein
MYQEIKADSLAPIMQAIKAAMAAPESLSVTLKKRGNDFEATLIQIVEREGVTHVSS